MTEELLQEEILLESIQSKIEKIKYKIVKTKSKAKKAYKKGKISEEEYEKINNICDRVMSEVIIYEGKKIKGFTKSQVKMRLRKTLTEIDGILGDKLIIQILKNAGCFSFFTGALSYLFFSVVTLSNPIITGLGIGASAVGGAAITNLIKKIINKFRIFGIEFNNFGSNISNTFKDVGNSLTDIKHHGVNSSNLEKTNLKEEVNYFPY